MPTEVCWWSDPHFGGNARGRHRHCFIIPGQYSQFNYVYPQLWDPWIDFYYAWKNQ